ncbi:gliding motility-associated ABC transporter ATP-binding subunit GldA [Flavobacteriales bacterium]|jgi:ABC-2 type transport system ATP-binding protein|nr:gliding motility-associated ABC transporter ATP-binding subunit GldA [Flavobacteriales bacterium]MDB9931750.1 gliding motility-associated ABC transporter ATP-binding subunit GldA [Flavobacteriales bacterium]MDC1370723.1 gliding motility-associated ABC transporter ATP-binding subunit GldA [Flavobacteriales bacterium]
MSIEIKNVTKEYGLQKALNDVSFTVNKGEILGFLGPNGAGKSTLMKIVTCYIPPTSGTVIVDGYDVLEDSLEIRKKVGYLPEHNPLYLDMYVKEYLTFIAGIHKLNKKKEKVSNVVDLVGLGLEQNKKIGQLSKGYKQRVGLAQALIHDPSVLILDEPTSGLDPNQLADIREVIKNIGKEKTVMFSSHIMQEIEAICDRIVIINRGNLLVDKDASQIMNANSNQQIVKVEFDKMVSKTELKSIVGVSKVTDLGENVWEIISSKPEDLRAEISKFAASKGLLVLSLQKETQKLESIFKELTH